MAKNTANGILETVFQRVGKRFGYDNVETDYCAFHDFNIKWDWSYNWIHFRVSDYLMDCPENGIEDIATMLFERITGVQSHNPVILGKWLLSDDCVKSNQKQWLRRNHASGDSCGEHKDLVDSWKRLRALNIVEETDGPLIFQWTNKEPSDTLATRSAIMKTIVVWKFLDKEEVPDYVLDFVLFSEYTHIKQTRKKYLTEETVKESDKWNEYHKFPQYDEARAWITEQFNKVVEG